MKRLFICLIDSVFRIQRTEIRYTERQRELGSRDG